MEQFNLLQFVGLSGGPTIQQAVQYLKNQWGLPTILAPVAAILLGIILNVSLAFYYATDPKMAIAVGLLTGLFASGWHEIAKK